MPKLPVKKKSTKRKKFVRQSSVVRRVERMSAEHDFIPRDVIKEFAHTPESFPKERKRRGRGYRPLRHALEPDEARALFDTQQGKCHYCKLPFGTVVYRNGVPQILKVTQDHVKPYSKFRDNSKKIVVLACDLCNMFKSNKTFADDHEARVHIRERFIRKNYSLAPPGVVNFTNGSSLRVNDLFVYAIDGERVERIGDSYVPAAKEDGA
jgi:hypothetical protein